MLPPRTSRLAFTMRMRRAARHVARTAAGQSCSARMTAKRGLTPLWHPLTGSMAAMFIARVSGIHAAAAVAAGAVGVAARECAVGARFSTSSGDVGAVPLRFVGYGEFGRAVSSLLAARLPDAFAQDGMPPFRGSSDAVSWSDVLDGANALRGTQLGSAAYVCSPDALHGAQAVALLHAGAHVLVEKPVTSSDLPQLEAAAREAQRVLMVGLQRRFDSEYIRAKAHVHALLDAGTPPSRVVFESRDPVPAHPDPHFVLSNSVVHDLDALAWIFDAEGTTFDVSHARAGAGNAFDIEVSIHHGGSGDNGGSGGSGGDVTRASVVMSKDHPSYVQRVVVDGDTFGHDLEWPSGNAAHQGLPPWFVLYVSALEAEFRAFADAIVDASLSPDVAAANAGRVATYTRTFDLVDRVADALEVTE